jgi:hypothetical protein
MSTIRLGVVAAIHNRETSKILCGLNESSCSGNDTQLRKYVYLKNMPVVWCGKLFVSAVDFHAALVPQTKFLDKLTLSLGGK